MVIFIDPAEGRERAGKREERKEKRRERLEMGSNETERYVSIEIITKKYCWLRVLWEEMKKKQVM